MVALSALKKVVSMVAWTVGHLVVVKAVELADLLVSGTVVSLELRKVAWMVA